MNLSTFSSQGSVYQNKNILTDSYQKKVAGADILLMMVYCIRLSLYRGKFWDCTLTALIII